MILPFAIHHENEAQGEVESFRYKSLLPLPTPIQPFSNFPTLEGPPRTLDHQIPILLSILPHRITLHMNIMQVISPSSRTTQPSDVDLLPYPPGACSLECPVRSPDNSS